MILNHKMPAKMSHDGILVNFWQKHAQVSKSDFWKPQNWKTFILLLYSLRWSARSGVF